MQDFEALRARVDEAARRMKKTQSQRSERNQSLVDILGQLERKFSAQEEELEFYKNRIGPLEHANAQLGELMEKMLQLLETGFDDESMDPIRRASAIAQAMLSDEGPAEESPETDEPEESAEPEQPEDEPAARYEDAAPELLAADLAGEDDDIETLPEVVRLSLIAQQTEGFENAVAHEPEPAPESPEIAPPAEAAVAEPPRPAKKASPAAAETIEAVEALASALDRKSAAGEPLEAGDIKALLERVEALAHQPADDDEADIDIPDARDRDDDALLFADRPKRGKTGTEG